MAFILWCLIIMGGLGVLFGLGLALASRFFHVKTDPRIEEIAEALPGVNCGACGYAGCDAYAGAVAQGAAPDLCVPGGRIRPWPSRTSWGSNWRASDRRVAPWFTARAARIAAAPASIMTVSRIARRPT